MTAPTTFRGGCACGAARFEAEGTARNPGFCHCLDCRKGSGAPVMAWFTLPRREVRWVGAGPVERESSPGAFRGFCPSCGTSLTWRRAGQDDLDLAMATLDDPEQIEPADHVWAARRIGWLRLGDGLPAFRHGRNDGDAPCAGAGGANLAP